MRRSDGWIALPAAGLAAVLLGVALATAFEPYRPAQLAVWVLLYAALATSLQLGSLLACRIAAPLGAVAAFAVAAVVLWHFREQTGGTGGGLRPAPFAAAALLLGGLYLPLLLRGRRVRSAGALAGALAVSAAAFALLLVGSYRDNGLRWQLLRENKLIGTPAYYLFAEPVASVRRALFAEHERPGAPPTPVLPDPSPGDPPDLVFVLVDTLRADSLAAYGGSPALMPRLDALAAQSLVFDDVLANATWTRPSVACFFTGLREEEHGAIDRGDRLPADRLTLAEVLRARGYETAAFVTNFGAVGRDAGFDQGFDTFEQLEGEPYARAAQVSRRVLAWLAARSARGERRPLFLYVHYLDPHTPYLSGGEEGGLRAQYQAELRTLDAGLGTLFDGLDAKLRPGRVLFLTSDHGEEFGEHGEGGHGHALYPEVSRLPVLLQGLGPPGRVAARLEARDFFSLLASLAYRPGSDPRQLAAQRQRSSRYTSVYSTTPFGLHRPYRHIVAVRGYEQDGYVLIWSGYGDTLELYDLASDPGWHRNLEPREPERARAMLREMDAAVPHWSERVPVVHSKETESQLKALGYVE